tara:strand:- start:1154 stop:1489 length:336 start_codon:yes stop_codon:yes gene_type:complete
MINITNYNEHPTRKSYTIFHFFIQERANYFQELLEEQNIWFESEIEEQPQKIIYFFGIKNVDLKKVEKINYLVSAKYRKPTISNKYVNWGLYIFAIVIFTLAILGYINSKT